MGKTSIEWTEYSWNPLRGCSRVSEGCRHCYAERVAARFSGEGQPYAGLIHPKTKGWNGKIRLVPEALAIPWRWSRGRRIFVNSMTDLFHENVPFEYIAAVFYVMAHTTRHTYQVLTKRPARMLEFFEFLRRAGDAVIGMESIGKEEARRSMMHGASEVGGKHPAVQALGWEPWREGARRGGYDNCGPGWPYHNVWLGVSVEDQATADERIPLLLHVPASVLWISAEPLLGPVEIREHLEPDWTGDMINGPCEMHPGLNWVVAGGESGPGARPMHPDWARSLRDQCAAVGVPFLFKQWGEWEPGNAGPGGDLFPNALNAKPTSSGMFDYNGRWNGGGPNPFRQTMVRVGKKAAGRMLDGRLHDEYPKAA